MPSPKDVVKELQELLESNGLKFSTTEQHWIHAAGTWAETWVEITAAFYSSKLLERALENHAKALIRSAEASEKHAESLTRATWSLVAATVGLIIVALLSAVTTIIAAFIARGS